MVTCLTVAHKILGSNPTMNSLCVCHKNHCNIQLWAQTTRPLLQLYTASFIPSTEWVSALQDDRQGQQNAVQVSRHGLSVGSHWVWHAFSRNFTVLPAHPRSSANVTNHICLCLPSRSWYSFTDPRGMEGWVGLGWLVGYIPKEMSSTGNWTRTRSHISVLTGPDVG